MKTLSSRILLLAALGLLVPFVASPASAAGSGGSSTRDAERLIAEIRTQLRPVENQIRNHPYITALERGQVSRDNLRAFAGEQYHILTSDLRSDAHMVSRFGATPGSAFFRDLVNGEAIAIGMMLDFAAALGLDEDDLKAYEPRPRGPDLSLLRRLARLLRLGRRHRRRFSGEFCRLRREHRAHGRRPAQPLRLHRRADRLLRLLRHLAARVRARRPGDHPGRLDGCASKRDIKRATRLLQAYEKDFWDAVATN